MRIASGTYRKKLGVALLAVSLLGAVVVASATALGNDRGPKRSRPTISNLSPAQGAIGATVTITGSSLTGATTVFFKGVKSNYSFNGVKAVFTVDSDSQITTTVPSGATTGPITVATQSASTSSPNSFTIMPAPSVSGFTPTSSPTGTTVTINGSGLTGATKVAFNSSNATYTVTSNSQITATVPSGATTGPISVSTPSGTATSTTPFTITSTPTPPPPPSTPSVSGFTPTSSPTGTTVTINGSGLTGATKVAFNSSNATYTVTSNSQITATVPSGATTGPISVSTPSGTATSTTPFTITSTPTPPPPPSTPSVSGFTPTSSPTGTTVTINGSGLTGATKVAFNSSNATYTVTSNSQITATVPSGATTGPISVSTPSGTATSTTPFTITSTPTPPPPPPPPVSGGGTTLNVSPSGSDSNACSQASPCKTFDRAYKASSPGDTVLVGSGSYPGQTIARDTSKTNGSCDGYTIGATLSGCVTFQAAPGATVSFSGAVTIQSSFVRLIGFAIGSVDVGPVDPTTTITDVVLDHITGSNLQLHNVRNFGDLGGSWGPKNGTPVQIANQGGTNASLASHLRFDGTWFHDAIQTGPNDHLECFQSQPADYVTIRNSKFTNCAQFDIELGGGSLSTHFLIENNVLARPCSNQTSPCGGISTIGMACTSGGTFSDYTIRFNSISGYSPPSLLNFGNGCTWGGTNSIYGNIFDAPVVSSDCTNISNAGFSWAYNVRPTGSAVCSATDTTGVGQWVASGYPNYDFHLISGIAIGLVPASVARPSTDIAGTPRGAGATDAGAYVH